MTGAPAQVQLSVEFEQWQNNQDPAKGTEAKLG
jgi:hypothetical protein